MGPADLESLSDLCTPWCIRVAVTLRIAEHISAGITQIDDLAAAAECEAWVLHRLLEHLVSKGVFNEPARGRFALNDAATALLDDSVRIGLDLNGIGSRLAHVWSTLLRFVQTGQPGYRDIFGLPFWEDLDAHPEIGASFDALIGPTGHGKPNPHFEITCGWDAIRTVVDVGGGTGAMLAELLRVHPSLTGTLVDLPRTVAGSADIFRDAGVAGRATAVGISFFEPLPAGADLYYVRGVLNDWPDQEAAAILRQCAEAAQPEGRVVVLKSVGPEDARRGLPIETVLLGGKHRTVAEFSDLARQSGLEVVRAEQQRSGYFVVECRVSSRSESESPTGR